MAVKVEPHEWVREQREDRGIRQVDVETRSTEIDPKLKISQSHLSKIEKGHTPLAGLGAQKLDVLRQILGVTPEEWVKNTGLTLVTTVAAPEPAPFDPRQLFHPPAQQRREKRALWPNLAQMIDEKKEKHPQLLETRWQQHLNQTRFSGGQEPDAEGWFEMYQAMRRNNVEPEPWPDDD